MANFYASETKDYSRFTLLEGLNREINENNLKELEPDILKDGVLDPILVDSNYRIFDGQHRFMLAKKHNLSLPYVVSDKMRPEIIPLLQKSKRWTAINYCTVAANMGDKDCKLALKYVDMWGRATDGRLRDLRILEMLQENPKFTSVIPDIQSGKYKVVQGPANNVFNSLRILDSYAKYVGKKAIGVNPYDNKIVRALKMMWYRLGSDLDLDAIDYVGRQLKNVDILSNETKQADALMELYRMGLSKKSRKSRR